MKRYDHQGHEYKREQGDIGRHEESFEECQRSGTSYGRAHREQKVQTHQVLQDLH